VGKTIRTKAKLPIGIQTFDEIRTEGYLYVDKTKYLVDLIDSGKVYFLSRPRRFGKSLTVSTFDALFSGKKELFEGLCAEEFFGRPGYEPHPVVHLDMSRVVARQGKETLRDSMILEVGRSANRHSVEISELASKNPATALGELIERLAREKRSSVAVLVDEYDRPVLDFVSQPDKAEEVRSLLRDFYVQIKAADKFVRFVFVTGISKFSKMGIFSSMNNLEDVSMDDAFAAMLGYTEEELLSSFGEYIGAMAAESGSSPGDLAARIRAYYDGFSFDGKTRLYNPFSVLNFFKKREFRNYWFESGTPSYLVEYVKRHDLEAENFRSREVAEDFADAAEIENAPPESFLFQSGYLSIRARRGRNFILDYPNMEVLSSVARLFLGGKFEIPEAGAASNNLEKALEDGRAEELVKIYNSLLASLPYDIYTREERQYAKEKGKASAPYRAESFYHAVLFSLLWSSRIRTIAEGHTYWGRSDVEAETSGFRYVVELKIAEGKKAAAQAADEAIAQIREKGYADKDAAAAAKPVVLLGLAVDKTERRVTEYRIETCDKRKNTRRSRGSYHAVER
jgi:hypothetical protein